MNAIVKVTSGFFLLLFIAFLSSCDEGSGSQDSRFDRGAMLEHYASAIIVPSFNDLAASVNALEEAVAVFTSSPTVEKLVSVQNRWKQSFVDFQYANSFNFGPAGEAGLQKGLAEEIGTFPVSVSKIEGSINNGSWNLNDFNRDARGFLAIEYLLFNVQDDQAKVVEDFQSAKRKQYLTDLVNNLKARVQTVVDAWKGTYKSEFISNTGTDIGSSTSQLYNEFVKSYESIKNYKIALPLGKRPGQTQPEPTRVEAYYSGTSVAMFKAHFKSIENLWYGKTRDGTDGLGFREYLETVTGGQALIASTEQQLASVNTALSAISDSPRFSEQLTVNENAVDALHTELQKLTRFIKSDMSSLLGIAITYASGDGD